ncbi:MAG: dihydrofolate reductase [Oscillibacter sp.]|nr:dihydrofolate reductase [Oscillibacter sp.]
MNAIVVVDQIWAIGREGKLLFDLPADMERFKKLTLNGTIIMGRRSLNAFVEGRPLPDRRNIVITRNADLVPPGVEVVPDPEAAVEAVADEDPDRVWVIGGGSVYAALLSRCGRAYLTRVETVAEGEPDTYFPDLDHLPGWEVERVSEPITENNLTFRFIEYINRNLIPKN